VQVLALRVQPLEQGSSPSPAVPAAAPCPAWPRQGWLVRQAVVGLGWQPGRQG